MHRDIPPADVRTSAQADAELHQWCRITTAANVSPLSGRTGRCDLFVGTERLGGALPNAHEKYRGGPFHIGETATPECKRTLAETIQFRRAGMPFAETESDIAART